MSAASLFDEPRSAPAPITLRRYQLDGIAAIEAARDRGIRRGLVVMPTGTGKTSVFAELVRRETEAGGKALVIAHREELLTQAANRIEHQAPGAIVGIEGGGNKAASWSNVVVGGVQTIGRGGYSGLPNFEPSLIIVDEAHHAPATSYQNALERFGAYDERATFTLGVTATPHRLDNKPLHGHHERAIFEEVLFGYTLREAIADGYLCDLRGYRIATGVDLSGVKTTAGDYNQRQLADRIDVTSRTRAAFTAWREAASDRRTIVFCITVDHARNVAEFFTGQGVRAAHVSGEMDKHERRAALAAFRSGELQVLTNVEIATEGVDIPEIASVLMLRPTQSWALYTQMVGRGLRPVPGKPDCVVVDVVDNAAKHSLGSVPAMMGLPPELDLEGGSATEALAKFEQLGDAAQGALFRRPCVLADLDGTLQAVDLLAELTVPEEVAKVSRLSWLKVGDGEYVLSCGGKRSARLTVDTLGACRLVLVDDREQLARVDLGDELPRAFRLADVRILETFEGVGALAIASHKWHGDPPSDKQVALLRKLGYEREIIDSLNKGQASALITQKLQGRQR